MCQSPRPFRCTATLAQSSGQPNEAVSHAVGTSLHPIELSTMPCAACAGIARASRQVSSGTSKESDVSPGSCLEAG